MTHREAARQVWTEFHSVSVSTSFPVQTWVRSDSCNSLKLRLSSQRRFQARHTGLLHTTRYTVHIESFPACIALGQCCKRVPEREHNPLNLECCLAVHTHTHSVTASVLRRRSLVLDSLINVYANTHTHSVTASIEDECSYPTCTHTTRVPWSQF